MGSIRQLLNEKGQEIHCVGPQASVFDAVALMAEKEVGALLVMDEQQLVGVISERDYARKVILKERASRSTPVADIMTTRVICVGPDQSVEEGLGLMTNKRIRHLPVREGETLLGMVSIGDLVKAIIAEQRFTIEQLESYIAG